MPDLRFEALSARPVAHSASPLLALTLRVTNLIRSEPVRAALLQCQVRLEAQARVYSAAEQEGLRDLFAEPARWGTTLRSVLWAQVSMNVPPFTDQAEVEMLVPCSYDFSAAASKYLFALQGGEAPLALLFGGTVFFEDTVGRLQVAQVPTTAEARFQLPVRAWQEVMEQHHAGRVYLSLERSAFERLSRFKSAGGLPTWERAVERLLDGAESRSER